MFELNNKVGLDWIIDALKDEMFGFGRNLFLPVLDGGLLLFMELYKNFLHNCNDGTIDYHSVSVKGCRLCKSLEGQWESHYKVYIIDDLYRKGSTASIITKHLIDDHGFNKKNIIYISMFRINVNSKVPNFRTGLVTPNKIRGYSAISLPAKPSYSGYGMHTNQKYRFNKLIKKRD